LNVDAWNYLLNTSAAEFSEAQRLLTDINVKCWFVNHLNGPLRRGWDLGPADPSKDAVQDGDLQQICPDWTLIRAK
jgi:hypothetical protein